jgi:hypothetical protein
MKINDVDRIRPSRDDRFVFSAHPKFSTLIQVFSTLILVFSTLILRFLRSSRCFLRSFWCFLRSFFSFWGIRRLCTKVAFLIDFKRLCSKTIEINGVASFWSIRRASDVKSIEVQVLDRFEQFSIKSNSSWIMLDSCSKVQWVENKLQIQWGTIATMDMTVASKTGARNQTNAYGLHKLIIYPYEHMRFSRGANAFGPAPQSLKTHRVWHVILHCTRVSTCETSWRVANKCIYIYGYIYTWLKACLLKGAFSPQQFGECCSFQGALPMVGQFSISGMNICWPCCSWTVEASICPQGSRAQTCYNFLMHHLTTHTTI